MKCCYWCWDCPLIAKYFLLTKMKYYQWCNFLLHVMTSKVLAIYLLLKAKSGLANLSKLKKIKQEKNDSWSGKVRNLDTITF